MMHWTPDHDKIIVSKEIRNMVKESEKFVYQDIFDRLKQKTMDITP